jgi:periplasmic divalent cation tolerance protein
MRTTAKTKGDTDTATDMITDGTTALVYTTWPDLASAELAATALLEAQLAACLNIIPGMTSLYRWNGKTERGTEVVMLIKTRTTLTDACIGCVRQHHPYTNPAALVLAVSGGSPPFLDWIVAETAAAETTAAQS